eukprot:8994780-Pyramimonas_sp.AAC.1
MRDERNQDPQSKQLPEIIMGPACVQVFLVVARKVSEMGDKVGMVNAKSWKEQQERLDSFTAMEDLTMLVKGCKEGMAYKEETAKAFFSLAVLQM